MPLISSSNVSGAGGSVGMIFSSTVTQNLSNAQSWTVPAGSVFRGVVTASTNSTYYTIESSTNVHTITSVGGTIYVRGILMVNG